MTQLCTTCLVTVAFGWSEVTCPECAGSSRSASLDAECVSLIAFGWEDSACTGCRGTAFEAEGLALAA